MKTKDLPLSENVEDRRGQPKPPVHAPLPKPNRTLAELATEPESPLANQAGIKDIK